MAYVLLEERPGWPQFTVCRIVHDDGTDDPMVCKDEDYEDLHKIDNFIALDGDLRTRYHVSASKTGVTCIDIARERAFGFKNPGELPLTFSKAVDHLLDDHRVDSVLILYKDGDSEWHSN